MPGWVRVPSEENCVQQRRCNGTAVLWTLPTLLPHPSPGWLALAHLQRFAHILPPHHNRALHVAFHYVLYPRLARVAGRRSVAGAGGAGQYCRLVSVLFANAINEYYPVTPLWPFWRILDSFL